LSDNFAPHIVHQQTSLQVPFVPERGSTAREAAPSGLLLFPGECPRGDDPPLLCGEACQDCERSSLPLGLRCRSVQSRSQHDPVLLFEVMDRCNAEEQVSSKPVELPQKQHRELPPFASSTILLKPGRSSGRLAPDTPGSDTTSTACTLATLRSCDRPLLNLQSMAGGSLFFR
jgi:hypothetical protein